MIEKIKELIETNMNLKEIQKRPKEELQLMRMYLNLDMAYINRADEALPSFKFVKSGDNENFDFIDHILANKYRVDTSSVVSSNDLHKVKNTELSDDSNYENNLKRNLAIFMDEIDRYNDRKATSLKYIDVMDYILNRRVPAFKKDVEAKFFEEVDLRDLLYVLIILEADLVNLNKFDEKNNIIEMDYLNIITKKDKEYYINILLDYYKNKKNAEQIKIKTNDMKSIFNEKNQQVRVYKIAALYKYIIETKKVDIIKALRKLLDAETIYNGMKIRAHYYKYRYFNKVDNLPYSEKTKNEIYKILNYILNYRYNNDIPYVPINIVIYSDDKEAVEYVSYIIGSFMFFFGYIQLTTMNYYDEYLNDIILDKNKIKNLYYEDGKPKRGLMLLHNFGNLLYAESKDRNLILNILTDQMEENNNKVCNVIYGEKIIIKQILDNYPKLAEKLINLELEIEDLKEEDVSKILIDKLGKKENLSTEIKEKIENYVRSTYRQSDIKNLDYINKLYNQIILNSNSEFSSIEKTKIKAKDIPQIYDVRDIPTILKDLNSLVGLTTIKEQIKDLIYLLKFNKKAKIDISKMNLHMVFTGNPGTGKTTVARLITDILYNLRYINKNKLVEITSRDLIAQYTGQTQEKTYNVIKSALGGVLFIDEAYSITMVAEYGEEAVATIIKMMEDYKDKLVIIFAGYEKEMDDFLKTNSGLESRVGYKIQFPDYTVEEMMKIYTKLLKKNKLKITEEAEQKLERVIKEASKVENFGNARYINNIFQKILIEHAKNVELNKQEGKTYVIEDKDINQEKLKPEEKTKRIGF